MPSDLSHSQSERLARLLELGGQLSAEQNVDALLERILDAAKNLTGAEGGTLYQLENDALRFMLMRNDRLDLHLGGQASEAVPFPPLALHHPDGSPNLEQVASHVALTARVINIADAYCTDDYDFSGTRRFDAQTGYRSRSFLTVPLTLPNGEVLGVLQLINALDDSGQVHAFDADDQALVVALAALAASALANRSLIAQLEQLMEGLIGMINLAIDEKSFHTGQHCMRVPVLVKLLAEAVHHCDEGVLADFRLDDAERYQLHIAGMVHDCGKLVTPDHIVNKSTKLEAIHDRIHAVAPRFTALARETERNYAERRLRATDERERLALDAALAGELAVLRDDLGFLRQVNQGGEYMSETLQARVRGGQEPGRAHLLAAGPPRRAAGRHAGRGRALPPGAGPLPPARLGCGSRAVRRAACRRSGAQAVQALSGTHRPPARHRPGGRMGRCLHRRNQVGQNQNGASAPFFHASRRRPRVSARYSTAASSSAGSVAPTSGR